MQSYSVIKVIWRYMQSKIETHRHPIPPFHYYELSEDDIRKLSAESGSGQIYFNVMLASIPVGICGLTTLLTVTLVETWKLFLFMLLTGFGFVVGGIFFYLYRIAVKNQKPFLEQVLARPMEGPIGDETKQLSSIENRILPEHSELVEGMS